MNYTNLYTVSSYSMNGSNIDIDSLVKQAKKMGYTSLALTDDNMYGIVKFYRACQNEGIKPILGLHIQVESSINDSTSLIVLAKEFSGYQNLLKLASIQAINHIISLEQLNTYASSLIAITLSNSGDLFNLISQHNLEDAKKVYQNYVDIFDATYIGLDLNDYFVEINIAPKLARIGKCVVLNKVFYLLEEDKITSDVLADILTGTRKELNGLLSDDSKYHLKTMEEIERIYEEYPEAIKNTKVIADMCDVAISFGTYQLPAYPVKNEVTAKEYLRALCLKGLEKRNRGKRVDRKKYDDRLQYELSIIDKMGFNDYFLIVWDFVKFAKNNRILVGPGRGSAAGSLVSYVLGITNVDPIEYDLLFERFLNPHRISMPDIDLDFPDTSRDEVIRYVLKKYGKEHVISIITFGTFGCRSALRDTARVLEIPNYLVEDVLKYIPTNSSNLIHFFENVNVKKLMRENESIEKLMVTAAKIEGLPRHVSTHAAGIIITNKPITTYSAVQPGLLDMYQSQYEASDLEKLGLLKMDFLGLRNLTIIEDVVKLISNHEKKEINVYQIPFDDKATYSLLREVKTTGIFQLESQGMRSLLHKMKVKEFEDVVVCLALFRPGPMENIPVYLKRRFKEEVVRYPHPLLEDILKPTNGIIVYQEQIMRIANEFAGYTLGEADLLRRAVSKKQEEVLRKERDRFVLKCRTKGFEKTLANEIYDTIVKFANYGFNRSHSVAYAIIAYWLAYLKANYSLYFMTVLSGSVIGSEKQTSQYIHECKMMNIVVYPPSINYSLDTFSLYKKGILYPLLGIKNIGVNTVKSIISEREHGEFTSFVDFVKRMSNSISKRVIESLVHAGCMDDFEFNRKTMVEKIEDIVNYAEYGSYLNSDEYAFQELEEYSYSDLCEFEKESLGFNLQMHPINKYIEYIQKHQLLKISELDLSYVNKIVKGVGYITEVKTIKTKRNLDMCFIRMEDEYTKIDGVIFSSDYNVLKRVLEHNNVYLFKGKIDVHNDKMQIIINNLHKL